MKDCVWVLTGISKAGHHWVVLLKEKRLILPSVSLSYSKVAHTVEVVEDGAIEMVIKVTTDDRSDIINAAIRYIHPKPEHL